MKRLPFFLYSAFSFLSLFSLSRVAYGQVIITQPYAEPGQETRPDYARNSAWAALPILPDAADQVPLKSDFKDQQATAPADVFFIHPTTYARQPTGDYPWNASLADSALNRATDESTILNQASVFNGSGRVYAPRYRQAHFQVFLSADQNTKAKALDLAYTDVKSAFAYYLKNYNDGRPIVIAAHSQGTLHAVRLLKEFFDARPLGRQLVVAYLIGMPVPPDVFATIPPGDSPDQTRCFVSWRTYAKGYTPDGYADRPNAAVCTNPLSWKTDEVYVSQEENLGGVGLKYTFYPHLADAQCHGGLLWIKKPYVKGRAFISNQNWHNADLNLFWANIRANVQTRVDAFLKKE